MNAIAKVLKVPGNVVSLNDDWGSGKTYSWHNTDNPKKTIRKQLEKCGKKTIYVSLFGKQSVSELKKEILNKSINTKGTLFHFFMIFILIFFLSVLIAIFTLQIIDNPDIKRLVLLGSVLLAGFTTGMFYEHILKFFAQKTLGFDHNNIDFSTILDSNKVVFCFDDLERLSENANLEEFMGFFELLSRQNFSILLIYNSNGQTKQHAKKWKEFKEKVIKQSFLQKKQGIIDVILRDDKLTQFEKDFVRSIYGSMQKASISLSEYVETERDYITNLANNFRFYKKLISAYENIKAFTDSYKGLDDNTVGNMLMYITVIQVHDELELPLKAAPTKDYLYSFLFGRELLLDKRNELKTFGSALRGNTWYGLVEFPTIYELLKYGDFDYKRFKQEHTTVSNSELEKYTMTLGHWLEYRKSEQVNIVKNTERLLQNEKVPFTSLENMRQVLTKYSVFCSYIEKDLETDTTETLSQKIKYFIDNNKVPLTEIHEDAGSGSLIHIASSGEEAFIKNKRFINSIFERHLLIYWIGQVSSITDIENTILDVLKSDDFYHKKLYLYVLFNDADKQQQIFKLRDTNYAKWQDIITLLKKYIADYDESFGFIKQVREILKDTKNSKELFVNALTTNVKELETLPDAGLSEQYTVKNFMHNKQ